MYIYEAVQLRTGLLEALYSFCLYPSYYQCEDETEMIQFHPLLQSFIWLILIFFGFSCRDKDSQQF